MASLQSGVTPQADRAAMIEERRRRLGPNTYAYESELTDDKFQRILLQGQLARPDIKAVYKVRNPNKPVTLVDHDPDLDINADYLGITLTRDDLIVADTEGKLVALSTLVHSETGHPEQRLINKEAAASLFQALLNLNGVGSNAAKDDLLFRTADDSRGINGAVKFFESIIEKLKPFAAKPAVKDPQLTRFSLSHDANEAIQLLHATNGALQIIKAGAVLPSELTPAIRLVLNGTAETTKEVLVKLIRFNKAGLYLSEE